MTTIRNKKSELIKSDPELEAAFASVDLAAESNKLYIPEDGLMSKETDKSSEQIIQDKITDTIDTLTNTVISNINRLRVQLDALETAMLNSAKATNSALKHHIKIGASAMKAAHDIESQIASFRDVVQETTPNSPPVT